MGWQNDAVVSKASWKNDANVYDPTADMSTTDKALAGVGKAFYDTGRGIGQMLGMVSREDVAKAREQDKALMNTTAGKVGNFAGEVVNTLPLLVIPGANTIKGATLASAAYGLTRPSESTQETITNTLMSGAGGAAGQYGANKLASYLGGKVAENAAEAQIRNATNSIKNETLKRGVEAGYVVPPSSVNPSFINKRLESIAGKAAVGQEAAARNQGITNALARKVAGAADDAPLDVGTLDKIRAEAGKVYKAVGDLSPIAKQDIEALKQARFDANAQFKFYNRSADPSALKAAKEARQLVDELEASIAKEAEAVGRSDLVPALKEARTQIAKTYDVERSLNVGSGDASAPTIGRIVDKAQGKPIDANLETIGRMQQAFPSYMREGASIPTPGVSKSEALAAALLGGGGFAAAGPMGLAASALPLLSGPARSLVLSKPYQQLMAKAPQEAPAITLKIAELLARKGGAIPTLPGQFAIANALANSSQQ